MFVLMLREILGNNECFVWVNAERNTGDIVCYVCVNVERNTGE